nr:hypothetical protein [Marinicella sp. W31]MDC2876754.1 hypothetical protein [Marinicella sp. W31]
MHEIDKVDMVTLRGVAAKKSVTKPPGRKPDERKGQGIAEGRAESGGGIIAAKQKGKKESRKKMTADERRPRNSNTDGNAHGYSMRGRPEANGAVIKINRYAPKPFLGPDSGAEPLPIICLGTSFKKHRLLLTPASVIARDRSVSKQQTLQRVRFADAAVACSNARSISNTHPVTRSGYRQRSRPELSVFLVPIGMALRPRAAGVETMIDVLDHVPDAIDLFFGNFRTGKTLEEAHQTIRHLISTFPRFPCPWRDMNR